MTTLKSQAEALGIEVNGRWSDETLQKKIDEATAAKAGTPVAGPSPEAAAGAAVSDTGEVLVDDTWDEDRLRAEIQMAREGRADLQVKGAIPPVEYGSEDYDPATAEAKRDTPVTLDRDYWGADGERIAAGTDLHMSKAEAKRLIAAGVAHRNDPL